MVLHMITPQWMCAFEAGDQSWKKPLSLYNITKALLYRHEKPLGTWGHCSFSLQRAHCVPSLACHVNTMLPINGPPQKMTARGHRQFHINKTTCENNLDCFKLRPLATIYHKLLLLSPTWKKMADEGKPRNPFCGLRLPVHTKNLTT